MNEEKKIEIVKDLIYESSTRQMLLNQSSKQRKGGRLYKLIGAAAAVIVLSFAAYYLLFSSNNHAPQQRLALAESAYQIPTMNATRGAQTATVDQYVDAYNAKDWGTVLPALEEGIVTEKDAYALATIYYDKGKLEEALETIRGRTWSDEYYAEQLEWLEFVIVFRQGESLDILKTKATQLSIENEEKAQRLLAKVRQ